MVATQASEQNGGREMTEAEACLAEEERAQLAAQGESTAADDPGAKKNKLPEIPIAVRAVITCRADLDQVLQLHKKWISEVLSPNVEVASGRANLEGCDLRGYDLSGVNLSGANLANTNLANCDLSGANLTVANLQRAVLACTNLQFAKLTRAKLDGADLRGADMTGAQLVGVDLSKCVLKTPDTAAPAAEAEAVASATVLAVEPAASSSETVVL